MQRGFVRKRGVGWTAYYHWNHGGQRRQYSKGGFHTKRDAQSYLTEVLAALQRGDVVTPTKLTVEEYLLTRWLPVMQHSVRPATYDSYQRMIDGHIVPRLGSIVLQDLSPDDLDRFYADLMVDGRLLGDGGLSPKTVRYIHTTLHKALRDAERKRLVNRNVAQAADPPKLRQSGGRELKTWTASESRTFLDGMKEHRLHAAFVLAATTGMRRGEVLGLRWGDIDFKNRRLAVRQTVLSINYQLSFGTPKTARGRRSIAIDNNTLAILQAHRSKQRLERTAFEDSYTNLDLVFARPEGTPTHPDYFSQAFDRSVVRLGLPRIRLHDLRHTHATLGLQAGVPAKVMADRLGHATVAFTQDVYMHAIPQLDAETAENVARLIFGAHAGGEG